MNPSRAKVILLIMVALVVILGAMLFIVPHGRDRDQVDNPAPHAPDQTPK